MKAVLVLLMVAAASALVVDEATEVMFQEWRVHNGRFYASKEEYARRLGVFAMNAKLVDLFNAGNHTFTVGLTRFADMTNDEYQAMMLMKPVDFSDDVLPEYEYVRMPNAPSSVDWRKEGAVNAIKDQGQCGSCYAFGGVASMEAAWKIAGHKLESFSEQEIVDCSKAQGNQGCNGGWHYSAMDYVIKNKGIDSEASYPYTAVAGTCKANPANIVGSIKSRSESKEKDEAALADAVAKTVVGIAIDASKWSFQMYKDGIYNEATCSSTSLDHAVAAVGYDTNSAGDYWIVRNSWGTSWGQSGYIWMSRNKKNQCGVATKPYYATA